MEYLEHHGGRLSEPDTRHMFFQMCKALQYCHEEMHVAHRDVKLENFLLVLPHHPLESQKNAISNPTSLGPRVLLADFGFASMIRTGAAFTRPCGSPAYAAPEVFYRSKHYLCSFAHPLVVGSHGKTVWRRSRRSVLARCDAVRDAVRLLPSAAAPARTRRTDDAYYGAFFFASQYLHLIRRLHPQ